MDNKNVYLFPPMIDAYQLELTQYLEQERYEEAKKLLRFLLSCSGDERQYAIEWGHLLQWLEQSFPSNHEVEQDEEDLEAEFRRTALTDYGSIQAVEASKKLMDVLHDESSAEQLLLALERAIYIEESQLNGQIMEWLQQKVLHPVIQYQALVCLRKRRAVGEVTLTRLGEKITVKVEQTPLQMNEFPKNVNDVLEKVLREVEVDDVTLVPLAEQLWYESMRLLYGTHFYVLLESGQEKIVNCFAAALHHTLVIMVYGEDQEEEIRDLYEVTEDLSFRYGQIIRVIRDLAIIIQEGF